MLKCECNPLSGKSEYLQDGRDPRRDELPPLGRLRLPLRRGKCLRVPVDVGVRRKGRINDCQLTSNLHMTSQAIRIWEKGSVSATESDNQGLEF